MTPRLASGVEVGALIRRVESTGGTAAVLARGDATAGSILLSVTARGRFAAFLDRRLTVSGQYRWEASVPQHVDGKQEVDDYIRRRRGVDGDIWVVELDVADAERFIAEMTATG